MNEILIKAQNICSKKEMCIFDISKKLQNWQATEIEKEDIIQSLIDDKFIDEQRYANAFTNDKFKFNKWGKIKISFQLKQRQISSKYIQESLCQLNYNEYIITLKKVLKNKLIELENKENKKEKLVRFAQSKGYSLDDIFKVFKTLEIQ